MLSSGLTREFDTARPDMPSGRFGELVLIKSKNEIGNPVQFKVVSRWSGEPTEASYPLSQSQHTRELISVAQRFPQCCI